MMKLATMYYKSLSAALLSAVLLVGCAASPSSEDDFGNSVRRMIEAQKYTPPQQAERHLPLLDGQKAEVSAQQYRSEAAKPARIYQDGKSSQK